MLIDSIRQAPMTWPSVPCWKPATRPTTSRWARTPSSAKTTSGSIRRAKATDHLPRRRVAHRRRRRGQGCRQRGHATPERVPTPLAHEALDRNVAGAMRGQGLKEEGESVEPALEGSARLGGPWLSSSTRGRRWQEGSSVAVYGMMIEKSPRSSKPYHKPPPQWLSWVAGHEKFIDPLFYLSLPDKFISTLWKHHSSNRNLSGNAPRASRDSSSSPGPL